MKKLVLFVLIAALSLAPVVFFAGCGETVVEKTVDTVHEAADTAAREANLKTIDSAIQMYYIENGEYPTDINQLVPSYLRYLPTDSQGGTYYIVVQQGEAKAAVR